MCMVADEQAKFAVCRGRQMNLDLYLIGWVHSIASLVALAVGAVVLMRPK